MFLKSIFLIIDLTSFSFKEQSLLISLIIEFVPNGNILVKTKEDSSKSEIKLVSLSMFIKKNFYFFYFDLVILCHMLKAC